jgi:hypothetical protein
MSAKGGDSAVHKGQARSLFGLRDDLLPGVEVRSFVAELVVALLAQLPLRLKAALHWLMTSETAWIVVPGIGVIGVLVAVTLLTGR